MQDPPNIRHLKNGFAHPKCFLASTNGCSQKISGEHFVSDALLNVIERVNSTIDIAGLPWIGKGTITSIGKSSLVSNILCESHNSSLSPIDSAVIPFVIALEQSDTHLRTATKGRLSFHVDGTLIERWILKLLLGLSASKQIKSKGEPLIPRRDCISLLCSPFKKWPKGWGLYFQQPTDLVHHSRSFAFQPRFNPNTFEVLDCLIQFNGFPFAMSFGQPDNLSEYGIFRPKSLCLSNGDADSTIHIEWRNLKNSGVDLQMSLAGKYSGSAPGNDLPRDNRRTKR